MRDPRALSLRDFPKPQLRHVPLVDYQDEQEIDRAVTGPKIINASVGWILATLVVLAASIPITIARTKAPWIPPATKRILAAWFLLVLVSRWSDVDEPD